MASRLVPELDRDLMPCLDDRAGTIFAIEGWNGRVQVHRRIHWLIKSPSRFPAHCDHYSQGPEKGMANGRKRDLNHTKCDDKETGPSSVIRDHASSARVSTSSRILACIASRASSLR